MKLALGTAQFGLDYGISNRQGKVSKTEIKEILDQAFSVGISTLDCAAMYGDSEQVLGQLIPNSNFNVITKIPPLAPEQESLLDYFDQSFRKLQQQQLHGLLLHQADDLIIHPKRKQFFQQLEVLKKQKLIKKIGASLYNPTQLHDIAQHFPIDFAQVPINIFDQRFLAPDIIKLCQEKKIKLHARSLFLQGLIFFNKQELPQYFHPFESKLAAFTLLAKHLNCSKLTLALAIVAQESHDYSHIIDKLIIGVCNCQELNELVLAYQHAKVLAISTDELSKLVDQRIEFINPSYWPQK
jgi:aryl-alcohol dehydrogenase-like predicted oxidoreductase